MKALLADRKIAADRRSAESRGVSDRSPCGPFLHLGLGWIGDRGGGLERYQDGICREHAASGVRVSALVQSRVAVDENQDYPVASFASPAEKRRVKLQKLRRRLRGELLSGPVTLVSHHASVSHAVMPLPRDVPHVVHFHGPWAEEASVEGAANWKTWMQRRHEQQVYRSADRLVTLSRAFKDLVVEGYGVKEDRVHVVPGAIDARSADPGLSRRDARDRLGWPQDRPIVLSIRRLVRRVGLDVLIDAVTKVVPSNPDLLVLIGGCGPLDDELDRRISACGLQDHVQRLGFVDSAALSTAYRGADFSIVPTQSLEGFGLVTLESMAAGTPAVVTPVGSLPEVVGPLSESLILPGKTSDRIAEGLETLLRKRVCVPDDDACRRYVQQNFDWSVIAPRVLDVYRAAV